MNIDTFLSLVDDDEVVQVTRELVAMPTVTTAEGMDIVRFFEGWFRDLGIPVRSCPYGDGDRANFFADFGAADGPERYMFNGHMDVKPVSGMTVDPWAGEIRDGRMYGRGTCDMKGGIAAALCAFKALVRGGFTPKGGITFFSDVEEEYGGGGYYWARDNGMYDGLAGFISCEPSDLEVQIGNRGVIATCFEARGRPAHTGLAHLGVNAVHNMARFITEYLSLPYLGVENPRFGKCTVNFEKIEGGLYLSAVPDRCIACLDTRLIPDTPPGMVEEQYTALMDRLREEQGIDIREIDPPRDWRPGKGRLPAEAIAPDHPLAVRTAGAFRAVTGSQAVISGCPAITGAMVLISMGIPAVICGPGSIAQAHTADEWVEVDQLTTAARIYTALMSGM